MDERNPPDASSWSYTIQENNDFDSFYNYNTKDRTSGAEAEEGEKIEIIAESGTSKEAEGEKAEDDYDSNLEMDDN